MANEFRVDAGIAVEADLKGENDEQFTHTASNLLDASGVPGPDLGSDIVEHGDATLRHRLGKLQVESWKIDEEDGVDRLTLDRLQQGAIDLPQRAQAVQRFYRSNHGQVADVKEQLHTSLTHLTSTHAQELQGRLLSAQGAGEVAAMQISRSFSGHKQQALRHMIIVQ